MGKSQENIRAMVAGFLLLFAINAYADDVLKINTPYFGGRTEDYQQSRLDTLPNSNAFLYAQMLINTPGAIIETPGQDTSKKHSAQFCYNSKIKIANDERELRSDCELDFPSDPVRDPKLKKAEWTVLHLTSITDNADGTKKLEGFLATDAGDCKTEFSFDNGILWNDGRVEIKTTVENQWLYSKPTMDEELARIIAEKAALTDGKKEGPTLKKLRKAILKKVTITFTGKIDEVEGPSSRKIKVLAGTFSESGVAQVFDNLVGEWTKKVIDPDVAHGYIFWVLN